MKGHRTPFRLRADGKPKLMQRDRNFEATGIPTVARWMGGISGDPGLPPSMASPERTRSPKWRAGSRRTKRFAARLAAIR